MSVEWAKGSPLPTEIITSFRQVTLGMQRKHQQHESASSDSGLSGLTPPLRRSYTAPHATPRHQPPF